MAALTGTQFITEAIRYGGEAVADANNETNQSMSWISAAVVNRHTEVCSLMNKWEDTTGVVNSGGLTLDIPDTWDWIAPIEIYSDSDYHNDIDFEILAGKIRFDSSRTAGETIYVRYRKAPNVYTAVSDTIVETANPRLRKILIDEFLSIFLATDNDLESSSAEAEMRIKSDRNS